MKEGETTTLHPCPQKFPHVHHCFFCCYLGHATNCDFPFVRAIGSAAWGTSGWWHPRQGQRPGRCSSLLPMGSSSRWGPAGSWLISHIPCTMDLSVPLMPCNETVVPSHVNGRIWASRCGLPIVAFKAALVHAPDCVRKCVWTPRILTSIRSFPLVTFIAALGCFLIFAGFRVVTFIAAFGCFLSFGEISRCHIHCCYWLFFIFFLVDFHLLCW